MTLTFRYLYLFASHRCVCAFKCSFGSLFTICVYECCVFSVDEFEDELLWRHPVYVVRPFPRLWDLAFLRYAPSFLSHPPTNHSTPFSTTQILRRQVNGDLAVWNMHMIFTTSSHPGDILSISSSTSFIVTPCSLTIDARIISEIRPNDRQDHQPQTPIMFGRFMPRLEMNDAC